MQRASSIELGFDPENVVLASMDVRLQGYDRVEGREFFDRLLERMMGLPGVESVGLANWVLFDPVFQPTTIEAEGHVPPDGVNAVVEFNVVTPGYFVAMRIPLIRGRFFRGNDDVDHARVAVVNQTFADKFWPGEDPLAKRVNFEGRWHEIVGITQNGKYRSLGEDPRAYLYVPFAQDYRTDMTLHLRTASDPGSLVEVIRSEVLTLDASLPIFNVKTMAEQLDVALFPVRMGAVLLGIFGVLGMLLTSVGLYGILAYGVHQRTHEIGVRMALGALQGDVLRLVIAQALQLTLIGVGLGLAVALAFTRFLRNWLYGMDPLDPLTFTGVTFFLLAVALVAALLPAFRATRVDPLVALRAE